MEKEDIENLYRIYSQLNDCFENRIETANSTPIMQEFSKLISDQERHLKMKESELSTLALNYWRLSNWVDHTNVERKMPANSSLRQIKKYLDSQGVELKDLIGQKYDNGYAADVMGIEADPDFPEEELIVSETIRPIILYKGTVIKYGQFILGEKIKEFSANAELPPDPEKAVPILINNINTYCCSNYRNKSIARKLRWCKIKLEKVLRDRRF